MTYDEVTDRTVIRKKRADGVEDEDEGVDEDEDRRASPRRAGKQTRKRTRVRTDRAKKRRCVTTHHHRRCIYRPWTPRSTSLERLPETVGRRRPVALKSRAAAAVSAYAAYAIAQRARAGCIDLEETRDVS